MPDRIAALWLREGRLWVETGYLRSRARRRGHLPEFDH
jgi:hypothetical protein